MEVLRPSGYQILSYKEDYFWFGSVNNPQCLHFAAQTYKIVFVLIKTRSCHFLRVLQTDKVQKIFFSAFTPVIM